MLCTLQSRRVTFTAPLPLSFSTAVSYKQRKAQRIGNPVMALLPDDDEDDEQPRKTVRGTRKPKSISPPASTNSPYRKKERGPAACPFYRKNEREGTARKSLKQIKKGDKVSGLVRLVTDEGLIVNIKAERDAFLHESQLGEFGPLSEWKRGDKVTANVLYCNADNWTIKLSLLEGGFKETQFRFPVNEIEEGVVYEGTLKKAMQTTDSEGWVRDGGAFVDFGCFRCDAYLPQTPKGVQAGGTCYIVIEGPVSWKEARQRRKVFARLATKEEIQSLEEQGEEFEEEEEEVPSSTVGRSDKRSLYADGADQIKKKVADKFAYLDDM